MEFVRDLFLNSYTGKPEKIIDFLVNSCEHTDFNREDFANAIRAEVKRVKEIPVTAYFVEMMNIFTGFNMSPPPVFFKMAKAFLALFGINTFIENYTDTQTLLASQLTEYYVTRTVDDFRTLAEAGASLLPNFFGRSLRQGISYSIVGGIEDLSTLHQRATVALQNCGEVIDLLRPH